MGGNTYPTNLSSLPGRVLVFFFSLFFLGYSLLHSPFRAQANTQLIGFSKTVTGGEDAGLRDEAGAAAYFKAPGPVNLQGNLLRNQFRVIETDTSNYIIGYVPVPNYPETEDVKVYVGKDGWVMAYYLKSYPLSRIFDGIGTKTRFEFVLPEIANSIQAGPVTVYFYDFRFPNATQLLFIGETRTSPAGTDTFQINYPSSLTFFQVGWYLYGMMPRPNFILDEKTIGHLDNGISKAGNIALTAFVPDAPHIIGIFNDMTYFGDVFGGLAIAYRDPTVDQGRAPRITIDYADYIRYINPVFPKELINDNLLPEITNISCQPDGASSLLIELGTNEYTTATLTFQQVGITETLVLTTPLFEISHMFADIQVKPDTLYQYQITVVDLSGNETSSAIYQAILHRVVLPLIRK